MSYLKSKQQVDIWIQQALNELQPTELKDYGCLVQKY